MADSDDRLESSPLSVVMTRPAMMLFIPSELAVTLGMGFFLINNLTHNLYWGCVVVPVWIVAAGLVRRDYNAVRVWFVALRLMAPRLTAYLWGGASVSPYPQAPARRFRGMPDAA